MCRSRGGTLARRKDLTEAQCEFFVQGMHFYCNLKAAEPHIVFREFACTGEATRSPLQGIVLPKFFKKRLNSYVLRQ